MNKSTRSYHQRMLVLVTLLCSLFVAFFATNAFAQEEQTTVDYWLWLDDTTDPVWPALVEQFEEEHPSINIEYEMIPLAQYFDRLLTAVSSGSAPDAARFKEWWLGDFVQNDLLAPLDAHIEEWPGSEDVVPNLYNTGRVSAESPVYMLPHQYITFYLYYRADRLAEHGLEVPETFDEFVTVSEQLTDPSQRRYAFGLRGGAGGQDQWYAFLLAGGCRFLDDAGNVTADNEVCVEANQWYIDLFSEHEVTPRTAPTDAFAQIIGSFESGITSMAAHHVGSSQLLEEAHGENLGVTNIPQIDPDDPATMAAMAGNVIFADSEVTDAAWTFLSWLTEHEAMDQMSRSVNGQLPVLRSVAEQEYYQNNRFFKLSLEQADYAVSWPPLPGVGYISSQLWQANMQRALMGNMTSQQMMDEIAEALETE